MSPSVEEFTRLLAIAARNGLDAAAAVIPGGAAPAAGALAPEAVGGIDGPARTRRLRIGSPDAPLARWLIDTGHAGRRRRRSRVRW